MSAAHEEVALLVLGLAAVDDDARAAARATSSSRSAAVERSRITSRSLLSAGWPASSLDHVALGRGHRQLGPDRRRALRDARQQLDAVEAQRRPRRSRTTSSPWKSSGAAVQGRARSRCRRATGTPGARAASSRSTRSVGNDRGPGAGSRPRRRVRSGSPSTREPSSPSTPSRGTARAVAAVERRRPDRDRGAALDLAPRRRARRLRRSRRAARRERLVHALERAPRARRGAPRREHDARRRRGSPPSPRARPASAASTAATRGSPPIASPLPTRTLTHADRILRRLHARAPCPPITRALRADRRSARPTSRSRSPSACARAASGRSPCRPTRCRSTRAWRSSPAWRRAEERAQLEHRLVSFLPVDARFSVGEYAELAHAEIDGLLAERRDADRRRRHRPVPARGARRARPAPAAARRACASAGRRELDAPRPRGAARRAAPRARPWAAETRRPARPQPDRPLRSSCSTSASSSRRRAARTSCGPSDTRHPTRLVGLVDGPRARSTRASTRASTRWSRRARSQEVRAAHAAGASETARKALGFERAARRRRRGDEAPHAQLRPPPADVDAQAGRRRARRRDRRRARRRDVGRR